MLYSSHQKGINQLSFKIELGTLKFCGNACKFQNSSPLSPWPDTKSILITILNKHDASLPAQMYCFFPCN